jgi:hypothetical protein
LHDPQSLGRRLALATVLSSGGTKCSLPALDAYPLPDASSGIWNIDCAEGSYMLMLSEGSRVVVNNSSSGSDSSDSPSLDPASSDSGRSESASSDFAAGHRQTAPLQP